MTTNNLLTKAAFATVMGTDRSQATRWAAKGMPVRADGMVDAVEAAAWVRRHVDSTQRNTRSAGASERRDGARLRQNEAIDDMVRCALRLAVHVVPEIVEEIAREANLPARHAAAVFRLSLSRAPELEHAVRHLMGVPACEDAAPFSEVSEPLFGILRAARKDIADA